MFGPVCSGLFAPGRSLGLTRSCSVLLGLACSCLLARVCLFVFACSCLLARVCLFVFACSCLLVRVFVCGFARAELCALVCVPGWLMCLGAVVFAHVRTDSGHVLRARPTRKPRLCVATARLRYRHGGWHQLCNPVNARPEPAFALPEGAHREVDQGRGFAAKRLGSPLFLRYLIAKNSRNNCIVP
jgi:hypothetical protein